MGFSLYKFKSFIFGGSNEISARDKQIKIDQISINSNYNVAIWDSKRDLIAKKHMMSAAIKKHPIFRN